MLRCPGSTRPVAGRSLRAAVAGFGTARGTRGDRRCQRVGEAGIGERLRSDEVPPRNDETFAGPADEPPTGGPPTGIDEPRSNVASGLPAPRRRTFAPALRGLHSLGAACAPPSMAPLAGYAVSRGTGSPSQNAVLLEGAMDVGGAMDGFIPHAVAIRRRDAAAHPRG